MSAHSAKRRMVEAWPCAPVTPTVQAVRGKPRGMTACTLLRRGWAWGVRDLTAAFLNTRRIAPTRQLEHGVAERAS